MTLLSGTFFAQCLAWAKSTMGRSCQWIPVVWIRHVTLYSRSHLEMKGGREESPAQADLPVLPQPSLVLPSICPVDCALLPLLPLLKRVRMLHAQHTEGLLIHPKLQTPRRLTNCEGQASQQPCHVHSQASLLGPWKALAFTADPAGGQTFQALPDHLRRL